MRPAIGMVSAVASDDGAIAIPDCHELQCSTCCVKSGNRNTLPYSPTPITAPYTQPTASERCRNTRRSTTGCSVCSSCQTNQDSEIAAVAARNTIRSLSNQSSRLPRSMKVCTAPTPITSRTIPSQSTPCTRRANFGSGR